MLTATQEKPNYRRRATENGAQRVRPGSSYLSRSWITTPALPQGASCFLTLPAKTGAGQKTSNPCGKGPEKQGRLENLLGNLRLSSGASPLAGVAAKGSGEHGDSGEAELPRRGADWQGGVSHLFCGMCPHTDNTGIRGPFLQNLLTASSLQLGATSTFSRPALP